jgi:hypothetical protein
VYHLLETLFYVGLGILCGGVVVAALLLAGSMLVEVARDVYGDLRRLPHQWRTDREGFWVNLTVYVLLAVLVVTLLSGLGLIVLG